MENFNVYYKSAFTQLKAMQLSPKGSPTKITHLIVHHGSCQGLGLRFCCRVLLDNDEKNCFGGSVPDAVIKKYFFSPVPWVKRSTPLFFTP